MPNFVSPGVYVVEKDISEYPPTLNSSVVAIVGFAGRGPIAGLNQKKATLVTSPQDLVRTFGEPGEAIKGQALEGSLEILESTNELRFIRCASGATHASSNVTIGACPAIYLSGAPSGMAAIGTADSNVSSVRFHVSAYDNNINLMHTKTYVVASSTLSKTVAQGGTTVQALKKVFGGQLDADKVGIFSDTSGTEASAFLVGAAAGGGAKIECNSEVLNNAGSWVPIATMVALNSDGGLPSETGSVGATASGTSVETSSAAYQVNSLYPGAGYNAGTKADGTTSGVSFEVDVNGGKTSMNTVNDLGTADEEFEAGMVSSSFLEDSLGTTFAKRTSELVTANFVTGTYNDITPTALTSFEKQINALLGITPNGRSPSTTVQKAVNPRFIKLVQGTYNLANGDNGIPTSDAEVADTVIGEVRSDGGRTGIEALDDDALNISVALAPGTGVGDLQAVVNALISKAESTQNFLALVSPPYAVGKTSDAIDWSNGFATSRDSAINSSYGAIYWPWLKVFQVFDGKDRWLAPEIYAARQIAVTDNVSDPWFAPAGFQRGRLTKPTDVEVTLNLGDRNSLYAGGNAINPIVNFPQRGIAIFGQRTSQREPTALDRVNIRRLMIFIRKQILASTQSLVFEPNDRFTWERVEQLINPMLNDIANRRGITEFRVVCDESINTPVRVDRNEMWCKVLIKPTKTAEIVVFELNLTNQSAQLG